MILILQDGARVERKRAWRGGYYSGERSMGPNVIKNMWAIQVFGSQRYEGSSETALATCEILGSRYWDLKPWWTTIEDWSLGNLLLDRIVTSGWGGQPEIPGRRSGMNIENYIATHCIAGTEKVGIQLPIRAMNNLSLNIIVLVLT